MAGEEGSNEEERVVAVARRAVQTQDGKRRRRRQVRESHRMTMTVDSVDQDAIPRRKFKDNKVRHFPLFTSFTSQLVLHYG